MPEPLLNIQNLSFSFGKKEVLKNLTLTLESNEIVTLLGSSGSGKSTLFNILTGIWSYQNGAIHFSANREKSISYMTQEDLLLPWRTVLDNLMLLFELGKQKESNFSTKKEALEILSEMGLKNYADYYPHQLSGGMKQRISLVRALLQKRPLLLLDEPFGSLDVVMREKIYQQLRSIKDKRCCTIFLVTHDFRDALSLSDRILLLHDGSIYKTWEVKGRCPEIAEEIRQEMFKM